MLGAFWRSFDITLFLYPIGVILFGAFIVYFPYMFKFIFFFPYLFIRRVIEVRKEPLHLYGISAFVGSVGQGKTMSMVHYLNKMRKEYGNQFYITTNFCYKYQDFPFTNWDELLMVRDKPLIVAWDEVQNEFSARDASRFPLSLLTLLTQNRKGHGVQIIYTVQHLSHLDKIFRDMTNTVNFCHTWLGRFTFYISCKKSDISSNLEKKRTAFALGSCTTFIQSKKDRDSYDTLQILQSARNRGYGENVNEYASNNAKQFEVSQILEELASKK